MSIAVLESVRDCFAHLTRFGPPCSYSKQNILVLHLSKVEEAISCSPRPTAGISAPVLSLNEGVVDMVILCDMWRLILINFQLEKRRKVEQDSGETK